MKPEHLTLKGFGPFRQTTEIDFRGVELFALTGPTGAGKTTILDGICFALYGSVPRHGKGAVAPVITQGSLEATVALEFSIGESMYQIARRVKKDAKGKGANTNEASLECGDEVLATGAGPVNEAVRRLLGLDFEQFTTCVLLPQGEFARFLHDKPAGRQELLVALLDLGVYERVGQAALIRQRAAEARLAHIDQRLGELGELSAEALDKAIRDEERLAATLGWLEEVLPEVAALDEEGRQLDDALARLETRRAVLTEIRTPDDLDQISTMAAASRKAMEEARLHLAESEAKLADAVEGAGDLPALAQVMSWIDSRRSLALVEEELAAARPVAASAKAQLEEAVERVDRARREVAAAADADRAAHLRRNLAPGDPCPVCGQPITEISQDLVVAEVGEAEKALAAAIEAEGDARKIERERSGAVARLEDRNNELTARLVDVAPLPELEAKAVLIEAVELALATASDAVESARRRLAAAEADVRASAEKAAGLAEALQNAWTRLVQAGLSPEPFQADRPIEAWASLGEWSRETQPMVEEEHRKTTTLRSETAGRRQSLLAEIAARLDSHGLTAAVAPARDVVVDRLVKSRSERQRIARGIEEVEAKTAEKAEATTDQSLSRQLTTELRADRFKKWLFDEVFTTLVAGANQRLADLTRGQYQLVMDGRDFEVIDHLSAGNRRSVRTLSGGETFLVSLALALSLADQVAESAANTSTAAGRLDSFFLDEGFGTLDSESMDIVAAVISELGADGKTVGIVTHVVELADQMPVRYRVDKGSGGAVVTRESL